MSVLFKLLLVKWLCLTRESLLSAVVFIFVLNVCFSCESVFGPNCFINRAVWALAAADSYSSRNALWRALHANGRLSLYILNFWCTKFNVRCDITPSGQTCACSRLNNSKGIFEMTLAIFLMSPTNPSCGVLHKLCDIYIILNGIYHPH